MKENMKKKKQKWLSRRHNIITAVAKCLLYPYVKIKYGVSIEKFKDQGKRQYLILSNHQTGFDQFFVAYAFSGAIYYVASEDIFSMGFVSDLLRWAVNPIPIKKQTTDISAVLNCMRVAKEGGTIAIFPEGNRTYSGRPAHINPAIIALAKKLALPIAFFNIEGGYGVAPRWGDAVRKGRMTARVTRVLEPEEYKHLTDCEFAEIIQKELYVDETKNLGEFHHKRTAEYLERAIYYCPKCGLSTFESHGDVVECKKCGIKARYLADKTLEGINFELPYRYVADWMEAQNAFVNSLDLGEYYDTPIYNECGKLYEVIVYKNKKLMLERAAISLYGDRIEINQGWNELTFKFDDIRAITVCGKNKLNLYTHDKVYQITGEERFNALKYVNIAFRYKNIKKAEKGERYDEFLGL